MKNKENDQRARKKTIRCYYKSKRKITGFNRDDDKDDNRDIYKEIFDKTVKEKFDGIRDLNDEIDHNYLTYYFKGDTAKKRFDDFNSGVELS